MARPARKAAWEGVTLPGDVYAGRVDPNSEEAFKRGLDLASIASPVSPAMGSGAAIARAAGLGSNRPLPPLTAGQQAAQTAIDLGAPLPRGLASDNTKILRVRGLQVLIRRPVSAPSSWIDQSCRSRLLAWGSLLAAGLHPAHVQRSRGALA